MHKQVANNNGDSDVAPSPGTGEGWGGGQNVMLPNTSHADANFYSSSPAPVESIEPTKNLASLRNAAG